MPLCCWHVHGEMELWVFTVLMLCTALNGGGLRMRSRPQYRLFRNWFPQLSCMESVPVCLCVLAPANLCPYVIWSLCVVGVRRCTHLMHRAMVLGFYNRKGGARLENC